MCPNFNSYHRLAKQQGGALAIAVFVILVMSLLTIAISRSISASSAQTVQEVLGTRALMAAESGNELALAILFPIASGAPVTYGSCADITASRLYFSGVNGLNNCQVVTSCEESTAGTQSFYFLESTGVCKDNVLGSNSSINLADFQCSNTDQVCVSRRIEIEAKTL